MRKLKAILRTRIHRPVFDALIGQRRRGFVQIDWEPLDALPGTIDEAVDFDGDGRSDFRVLLDTGTGRATLAKKSGRVLHLIGAYKLEKMKSWTVRVGLLNPDFESELTPVSLFKLREGVPARRG